MQVNSGGLLFLRLYSSPVRWMMVKYFKGNNYTLRTICASNFLIRVPRRLLSWPEENKSNVVWSTISVWPNWRFQVLHTSRLKQELEQRILHGKLCGKKLVHTYDAIISILSTRISTRKSMCEPGWRKHTRKHKTDPKEQFSQVQIQKMCTQQSI